MRMNRPVVPRFLSSALAIAGSLLLCTGTAVALDANKVQLPVEQWGQLTILNQDAKSTDPVNVNYRVCRMVDRRQNYQSPDRKETCLGEQQVTVEANGMKEIFAREQIQTLRGGKEQDGGSLYYIRVTGISGGSGEQKFKVGEAAGEGAEYKDVLCLRRFLVWHKGEQYLRPNVMKISPIHGSRAVVCEDSSPNIYPGLEDPYYNRNIIAPATVSESK